MNTALIYYTAHKIGYCEASLRGSTEPLGVNICKVYASVTAKNLGENINTCLNEYKVLFIVGDISRSDGAGLMTVLSRGFGEKEVVCRQIKAENSRGYLMELEGKVIVILPDAPEKISTLVSAGLIEYLKTES